MKKRSMGAALAALVCTIGLSTGGLATGAHAAGGDAKQISAAPMTCTTSGVGTVAYNKSGSRITLNVGVSGVKTGSGWRITVTDTLSGVVARTSVASTASAWTALLNYDSPKGTRTVRVVAASISGTNTCRGSISYRV